MSGNELFGVLPGRGKPQVSSGTGGAPRLREPQRGQIELRAVDVDSLLAETHPARVIWAYVEGLDLSGLEDRIKARGDRPGHPAISPRLMLALWLYATSQGVGSARALERLCGSHDVYRWFCGGVSVNYHTLADFRVGSADLLDRLMAEHLAALCQAGLVDLDALAQDDVRIRASAATGSFRRQTALERQLETAQAVVAQLRHEVQAGADASERHIRAARQRAAHEREQRLQAAQTALAELERKRVALGARGVNGKTPRQPRASTTDADARVMKMADAGFRPAYNVQVASTAGELIVVAVEVTNTGSDHGLMRPMLERARALTAGLPYAILSMAVIAVPMTSSGHTAKGSRSIVHPSRTRPVPIPICRDAAMAREWRRGERGWAAKPAKPSIRSEPSASASTPAGETGVCANSPCEASQTSAPSHSCML